MRCFGLPLLLLTLAACTSGTQTTIEDTPVATSVPATATPAEEPTATPIPDPTSTPAPTATPIPATPEPEPDWWPTTFGPAQTDRATRTQAAYTALSGVYEIDGAPTAVQLDDADPGQILGWVGPDRTLVTANATTVRLWNPDGTVREESSCNECFSSLIVDDSIFVNELSTDTFHVLAGTDLQIIRTLEPELESSDAFDGRRFITMLALDEGRLLFSRGDKEGPAASGGPEQIYAYDLHSDEVTELATTDANMAISGVALSPDGSTLAVGGLGYRSGFCSQYQSIDLIDMDSGEISPLGTPAPTRRWHEGGGIVSVIDVFWAGPDLYATIERFVDLECEVDLGVSLMRYDERNNVWDIVDWGPVLRVRPIGADAKIYILPDNRLFWEQDGASTELNAEAYWLTSTPVETAVDLRPAGQVGTAEPIIYVEPWGDLAGVPLYTEAETAIAQLTAALGPPELDTGWDVGCPLDGDDLNERSLYWGALRANFDLYDATPTFSSWSVRTTPEAFAAAPGGIQPDQISLPGGIATDATLAEAASRLRLPAENSPVFGIAEIYRAGFQLVADTVDNPIFEAAVPFIATCE